MQVANEKKEGSSRRKAELKREKSELEQKCSAWASSWRMRVSSLRLVAFTMQCASAPL